MNIQTRFSDKLEWVEHHGRLVLRKAAIDPKTKTVTIFTNAIRANYPKDFEDRLKGTLKAAQARALNDGNWDEDEHPRDEDGKFTTSGGSNDGADAAVVGAKEPELNPEVVVADGDKWNRELSIKLEKEYQLAKPELEAMLHKSVGEEVDTAVSDEDLADNAPVVPEEWDMLGESQQDDVKEKWKENAYDEYYNNEVDNWYQSGEALHIAKNELRDDFENQPDWATEALQEVRDELESEGTQIPFDDKQLFNAMSLDYDEDDYEGNKDPEIEFDDSKLTKPDLDMAGQEFSGDPGLPGIEQLEPHQALTEEMRDKIKDAMTDAFNKKADSDQGSVDPPEYLAEQTKEGLDEYWDQKDDSEKFDYAKNNTDIIDEAQKEYDDYYESNGASGGADEVAIPDKFDPLQEDGGADYKKTHALVTFMSRQRAFDLLKQRGLIEAGVAVSGYRNDIRDIDNQLWKDWKDSSAGTFGGQILQLASHEELGARYREMPTHRTDLIKQADKKYKEIGGFAGIKAMVRAKWETSQFALDKAGVQSLVFYRGLKMPVPDDEPIKEVATGHWTDPTNPAISGNSIFEQYHDMDMTRNGAYSFTTSRTVANNWNAGSGQKVVLRVETPRTSILSFPAYGINVHTEKEVVLAGTAFHGWDVWKHNAPDHTEVPVRKAA